MDTLSNDIKEIKSEVSKLKERLVAESSDSNAKLERLQALYRVQDYWRTDVKTLSDVPGIRQPQWYVVDIPFEYGATEVQAREVNMSANNAFVCTQVQSYYLSTDSDTTHYDDVSGLVKGNSGEGRLLPCSAFAPYVGLQKVLGMAPLLAFSTVPGLITFPGQGQLYPELEFQIEIEGSGRFWVSPKMPAAAFYGVANPMYLAFEGVVENVDKIKVYAYPTTAINLKGTVRFVLHGYSIGSDITLQKQIHI